MVSHSEIVPLSIEKVWAQLIHKIDHPESFVPGVSNVRILEKNNEFVMRSMDLTSPDGLKISMLEKITFSPYLVRFLIVDHPKFNGFVDNIAEKLSENETKLTYEINWTDKITGKVMNDEMLPKKAVLKSVEFILGKFV
jgi:hypothetical protein